MDPSGLESTIYDRPDLCHSGRLDITVYDYKSLMMRFFHDTVLMMPRWGKGLRVGIFKAAISQLAL